VEQTPKPQEEFAGSSHRLHGAHMIRFLERDDEDRPTRSDDEENGDGRACAWVWNDGGRKAAGFKGTAPGDCVTRAIAIALELPYQQVYDDLNALAKATEKRGLRSTARTGVIRKTYEAYLKSLGWNFMPMMQIGRGCTCHMRANELPSGRIIVRLSHHLCAIVDGWQFDIKDQSRGGMRCVYGYFTKESD